MKKYCERKLAGLVAITALVLCGCNPQNETSSTTGAAETTESNKSKMAEAVASLVPTQGNDVKGTVTFTQTDNGVRVVAEITGLKPGEHGFHIHEKGDCSAPDASSAGGHFNPTGMPHGGPDSDQHHLGDMGNITADDSGKATLDRVFSFLEMSGQNSIVGHAVIVHEGKDDFTTQPTGNAGARLSCGVIKDK
jgi:Cu-Zn family superoxide dismutase